MIAYEMLAVSIVACLACWSSIIGAISLDSNVSDSIQQAENDEVSRKFDEKFDILIALGKRQLNRLEAVEQRQIQLESWIQRETKDLYVEISKISREIQQVTTRGDGVEITPKSEKLHLDDKEQEQTETPHSENREREINYDCKFLDTVIDRLQVFENTIKQLRSSCNIEPESVTLIRRHLMEIANATDEALSWTERFDASNSSTDPTLIESNDPVTCLRPVNGSSAGTPTDCWDIFQAGCKKSGVYEISPIEDAETYSVYCQMAAHGGGWTVIQNRNNGTEDFLRDWDDYKSGFGKIKGDHWLGLERIHQLTTSKPYEILFEIEATDSRKYFAIYDDFAIDSEIASYALSKLGNCTGNIADGFSMNLEQKFSTKDKDFTSCVSLFHGAWWHTDKCSLVNLNVQSDFRTSYHHMHWATSRKSQKYAKTSRMSIRPRDSGLVVSSSRCQAVDLSLPVRESSTFRNPYFNNGSFMRFQ